jgi:hypothetical protein
MACGLEMRMVGGLMRVSLVKRILMVRRVILILVVRYDLLINAQNSRTADGR